MKTAKETMTKEEIIDRIVQFTEIDKADAERVYFTGIFKEGMRRNRVEKLIRKTCWS
jgi:hypothetical protein